MIKATYEAGPGNANKVRPRIGKVEKSKEIHLANKVRPKRFQVFEG